MAQKILIFKIIISLIMDFTWDIIIILLLLGSLFGILSTMTGTGGGVFYVSFITVFLLVPINASIDTSNFIILLTSASGFIMYLKDKRTNLKLSLIFSGFSIIGCLLSTLLLIFVKIDNTILRLLFATLLIIIGLYMVYKSIHKHKKSNNDNINKLFNEDLSLLKNFDYRTKLKKTVPLFFLAGFASNLLGIGGGVIITPALNLLLNFPIHYATAVSTSIVFFLAIYNSLSKLLFGQVELILGLLMGLGSILGAIIGAKFSKRMPKLYLQLFVAIVLIVLAISIVFLRN
ncbi:MAG: sulfite exporter TauE/SafE family protein [Candidatus Hermodarchaeota archaeon]